MTQSYPRILKQLLDSVSSALAIGAAIILRFGRDTATIREEDTP